MKRFRASFNGDAARQRSTKFILPPDPPGLSDPNSICDHTWGDRNRSDGEGSGFRGEDAGMPWAGKDRNTQTAKK